MVRCWCWVRRIRFPEERKNNNRYVVHRRSTGVVHVRLYESRGVYTFKIFTCGPPSRARCESLFYTCTAGAQLRGFFYRVESPLLDPLTVDSIPVLWYTGIHGEHNDRLGVTVAVDTRI
uniref:Uncharacterized protein n=1 Tax=Sipha flava TaxID=143950 RepID=A0A2S2QK59_9HEMI